MPDIRLAGIDDAADIAAIYRPYVTDAVTSFEIEPPDAREMSSRMAAVLARAPWLVYSDAGGAPIGYAYASRHHERAAYQWSVDVAVYIHAGHHRRGVGRALYEASVGLHESLGFQPVGVYPAVGWKFGAWRDVGWWRLPLQPLPTTPAPPLSLADAQSHPDWPAALR